MRKFLRNMKRLILAIIAVWMLGCIVSFLSGALLSFVPIPWAGPLPWSDMGDFVETPDGKMLVELRFYNRVLCYDRDGELLAAYRLPRGSKATQLAVDQHNLIYFRAKNTVYTYSSTWEVVSVVEADAGEVRTWELSSETGQPIHVPQRRGTPPDRALVPGDLLFAPTERRDVFHCADGTTLHRVGSSLNRRSPAGDLVATYQTFWCLRPFVFPFPGVLAWLAFFILFLYLSFVARRAARRLAAREATK
jgi:hypothetical protein